MKKLFVYFLSALLLLTISPLQTNVQASSRFSDIPRDHWAYEAIHTMADKGVIQGYKDGKFYPNKEITRAEFAKIMMAAAGLDTSSAIEMRQTFKDVPRSHWAFTYVEHAKPYLTGYKSGSTYTYKPDQDAVREDIAVALVRLLKYDQTKKANENLLDDFRDDYRISPALRPYIAIAVQENLIKGFDDKTFRPLHPITRAEAASLLFRANLDETKVVFPSEPTKPKPEAPTSFSDSFSDDKLGGWDTDKAAAIWAVYNKSVTAVSTDSNLDHYLLPLDWKDKEKMKNYEFQVDVNIQGQSKALGGLFFNNADGKADVVFITKDTITISKMEDVGKKELKTLASVSHKLQKSNKLKVVVKGNSYSVYVNGAFMYSQQNTDLSGKTLGLYLQKEATTNLPDDMTTFDNFSFKLLP